MEAGAGCAVIKRTLLRGQNVMCVELHRDGKRMVFVCTRCSRRCYSDAALVDHLQSNTHTRLSAALTTIERNSGNRHSDDERAIVARGFVERPGNERNRSATHRNCVEGCPAKIVLVDPPSFPGPPKTSLEWIGSDELFFSVSCVGFGSTPVVDSTWFNWKGKGPLSSYYVREGSSFAYAVVKFAYGDMIGRGVSLSSTWKKANTRAPERFCFICHQRMSSGNDVAALLNLRTKRIVCGSRNKQGVFHVYHPNCLIDWISMCELKAFTGQVYEGAIFCPECQGTGSNLRGTLLERPRYSLAEVFDRILELIRARMAWTDNRADSRWGLLFNPQLQGTVQSRGLVHYYSGCVDLLTGSDV